MAIPGNPHILEPGYAPTPFAAEEIRRGCPAGRTTRLLVEPQDGEPYLRISRFVEADEDGALIEARRHTVLGQPLEEPAATRTTWREFQGHASFPADLTTIATEAIETPLGMFDCLRYTVTVGTTVETFWFAKALPGMPIRFMTQESGRVTVQVTMIENAHA